MTSHPMKVLDDYKSAVYAKDVDGFVALYDADVRIFDMWGQWLYDGVEAWRGMVEDWFGSLGAERVVVEMDDVQIVMADDLAVIHSFITYKGVSAEGQELRAMQNRLTNVLKQKDGLWKIIHQHSSAPANFETGKVMFRR